MNISFQNVLDADGIGIAITGMLIVFSGLVFISIYIALIPKILPRMESGFRKLKEKPSKAPKAAAMVSGGTDVTEEMMAAIAYVIRMEREYEDAEDHQRITVVREEAGRVWAVTGRLRNLSNRM
jgi:Na+-transporting methylmalonyl-CoA/oxaloacetate decarboxylase gamma subunit